MKTKKFLFRVIGVCLITITAFSCGSSGKLTKRYKSYKADSIGGAIAQYINVSGYTVEGDAIDPPKPKSIFDLSSEAQQELIKQVAAREKSNEKLFTALATSLSAKSSGNIETIDLTRFQKRLVISVKKLGHAPADRVGKIDIKLKFSDQVKLLSCNRLATEYLNIDLGKLNYSNSVQSALSANLSSGLTSVLSAGGGSTRTLVNSTGESQSDTNVDNRTSGLSNTSTGSTGLSASLTGSRTFAEEVLLKQRLVGLQVSISNNTLNLYQEGISGIDLSGNIIADVTFELAKDIAVKRIIVSSELSQLNGIYNDATAIRLREVLVMYPNAANPIGTKTSFIGEYRKVIKGDQTISESDDVVELKYGEKPEDTSFIGIISVEQLRPKMWKLFLSDDATATPVQIFMPSLAGNGDLIFNSATEAKSFMLWFKAKHGTAAAGAVGNAGHRIILPNGLPLTSFNVNRLILGVY